MAVEKRQTALGHSRAWRRARGRRRPCTGPRSRAGWTTEAERRAERERAALRPSRRSGVRTSTAPPDHCPPATTGSSTRATAIRAARQLGHRRDPGVHRQPGEPATRRRRPPEDHRPEERRQLDLRPASRPSAPTSRPPRAASCASRRASSCPTSPATPALGYWPAFWTLGDAYRGNYQNWPGIGEFDIMENVNGQNTTHGVLHCGTNPGGPCNETTGIGKAPRVRRPCQAGFHEYALELDRTGATEELRWYAGRRSSSTPSSETDVDAKTWADATDHGHFILLNLAMGGAFPDGVAGQQTPTAATQPGGSLPWTTSSVETTGGARSDQPQVSHPRCPPAIRDRRSGRPDSLVTDAGAVTPAGRAAPCRRHAAEDRQQQRRVRQRLGPRLHRRQRRHRTRSASPPRASSSPSPWATTAPTASPTTPSRSPAAARRRSNCRRCPAGSTSRWARS